MRLRDGGFVGLQNDFGAVVVDVERSEDQDQSGEGLQTEQEETNSRQHTSIRPDSRLYTLNLTV